MTKTKNKVLALALATCLSAGTLGAFGGIGAHEAFTASALDATSTVTYPFTTGSDAFKYAPSFTGVTETGGDHWEFIQVKFDTATVDFTDVTYVAVEIRADKGSPSFTVGLHQSGNRFMTGNVGAKCYFVKEDGTVSELTVAGGTDINFAQGSKGTLLVPLASLKWQWETGDLTKVDSFYLTHNTNYFANWKLTVGSIGIYKGEPDSATLTKIADCSAKERAKDKYYVDSSNPSCMQFPSEAEIPEPEPPVLNAYPFRTGEDAYYNTETWSGFVVDGSKANQQTVKVKFDTDTADFSNADYLVVQYKNNSAPGLQYILNEGSRNYGVAGKDGERVYFAEEGKTQSALSCKVLYSHINVSQSNKMGALIIPMTSMKWSGTAGDLSKIDALTITTNSQYNGDFELLIGEIGMYDEDTETFTKLLDLSSDKSAKFTVSTQLDENKGKLTHFKAVLKQLGDASVDFRADKMSESSFTEVRQKLDPDTQEPMVDDKNKPVLEYTMTGNGLWDGGSYGKIVLDGITDSYGEQAVQLTALGTNPFGDGYTAFTLSGAGGFSWANKKGISFWARNDSDTEVSFNIEVDCRVPNPSGKGTISDRFNVKQGHRFYLYDVNTDKTSIYMTRPCATLPVGFEGWVRIPFTAFARADWSTNGVTQEMFMGENSVVSYLAITAHAATYQNKSFTVNMFGAYETSPCFESVFVKAEGKTIPELMQLSTLLNKEEN